MYASWLFHFSCIKLGDSTAGGSREFQCDIPQMCWALLFWVGVAHNCSILHVACSILHGLSLQFMSIMTELAKRPDLSIQCLYRR